MADWPPIDGLSDLLDQIRERLKPVAVIMFGSLTRGSWRKSSDADLLVILGGGSVALRESGRLRARLATAVPSDVFIYGERQFEEMIRNLNFLAIEALATGTLLYASEPDTVRRLEDLLANVSEAVGLERTSTGWRYDRLAPKSLPIGPGRWPSSDLLAHLDALSDDAFFDPRGNHQCRHRRFEGWIAAQFARALARSCGIDLGITIPESDPPDILLWRTDDPEKSWPIEITEVFPEGRRRDEERKRRAELQKILDGQSTEEEKRQAVARAFFPGLWSATHPEHKRLGHKIWNVATMGPQWIRTGIERKVAKKPKGRPSLLLHASFEDAHELGEGGRHANIWKALRPQLESLIEPVFDSAWLLTLAYESDLALVPHVLHLAGREPTLLTAWNSQAALPGATD